MIIANTRAERPCCEPLSFQESHSRTEGETGDLLVSQGSFWALRKTDLAAEWERPPESQQALRPGGLVSPAGGSGEAGLW
jgi:hypothetical protein